MADSKGEQATTIRAISRLDWRRDPDGILVATVQADAFCQAMVRSLVGAQLFVGDGRKPAPWPASLLDRAERHGNSGKRQRECASKCRCAADS